MSATPPDKRVFIYLNTMPRKQGSGASLRFYSNVRAYLDLGFEVEVIQAAGEPDGSEPSEDLRPVEWTRVFEPEPPPSLFGRLLYRAGVPGRASVDYYFPHHRLVAREVAARLKQSPGAVHHLEGESHANVLPWLPNGVRAIWSLHDLPSTVVNASIKIACEAQRRAPTTPERRELKFAHNVERFMARHAPLILCISDQDRGRLESEWGCQKVEYLPMSIPDEGAVRRTEGWMTDGKLRLLHLGRVSHLPSFRSLEFLFEQVFPRLPPRVLERVSLDVVGRVDDDERSKKILAAAEPYPNVSFHGFVDDVIPYYQRSDVQIVSSTDAAGLRTRIVESFAYGLPVLSTTVGAGGIRGIEAGENLLIADTPEEFAQSFALLIESPRRLSDLARGGLDFYAKNQSRAAVAAELSRCLQHYFGIRAS
jgi:glycosyltransferase involved in cell wall biosynthesis